MTTKTAQFTPGPWELSSTHRDEQYIDEPKAEELRPLFRIHWDNDVTDHEAEQGANLIAAAPAMYEALQIMVRAANVDEIDPLVMFASIERARHVLKLAEGKSA